MSAGAESAGGAPARLGPSHLQRPADPRPTTLTRRLDSVVVQYRHERGADLSGEVSAQAEALAELVARCGGQVLKAALPHLKLSPRKAALSPFKLSLYAEYKRDDVEFDPGADRCEGGVINHGC